MSNNINIIQSGSSGNCIVLLEKIMLDCGVTYSKIKDIIENVQVIFISHIHQDHCKDTTIKKIAYEHPNIKFVVGVGLVDKMVELGVRKQNIWVLNTGQWYNIGICDIKLDYLYHDVPNYCVHLEINNQKIIYATDTSKINHVIAENYDYAFIEANYYTDDELNEKILECDRAGKFTHLKRVKETHLSQLKALNWLQSNNIKNYKFIHIHENKEE